MPDDQEKWTKNVKNIIILYNYQENGICRHLYGEKNRRKNENKGKKRIKTTQESRRNKIIREREEKIKL